MKKLVSFLILIVLIFALTAIAFIDGIGGITSGEAAGSIETSPYRQATDQAAEATAAYGAEQFYIQLTAIADQKGQ